MDIGIELFTLRVNYFDTVFVEDRQQGFVRQLHARMRCGDGEAAELLWNSRMLRDAFGDDVVEHYHRAALWEIEERDRIVTDWEVRHGFEQA